MRILAITDPAELIADAALAQRIDDLGARSAVAQHLARPITTTALFTQHATVQHQQLIVAVVDSRVVGFLKTGFKHLFYVNAKGIYTEIDPLCVLDFFVLDDHQRHGIGLQLFTYLLESASIQPAQLAYDRPSPKLLAFLRKHAKLESFTPQPNNFVVFDAFFNTQNAPSG